MHTFQKKNIDSKSLIFTQKFIAFCVLTLFFKTCIKKKKTLFNKVVNTIHHNLWSCPYGTCRKLHRPFWIYNIKRFKRKIKENVFR